MRPIGAPDKEWSVGYAKTYLVDGIPMVGSWGGGNYTARTAARVGRLMLRDGDWDGKQLISKEAVRETTIDAGTPGRMASAGGATTTGISPNCPRTRIGALARAIRF